MTLITHCGAYDVTSKELSEIRPPPPTTTWFPVSHEQVLVGAQQTLSNAGFTIERQRLTISRQGHRFFATLDLATSICEGISLAVGIRNSTDKSFPIGFCCGQRVFVCDNLAFTSEIVVAKKHTRFGQERYFEGIASAVAGLREYRQTQASWIGSLRQRSLTRMEADSLILRSYEDDLIGARMLPELISEWRQPSCEEFRSPTAWSLWNAFTAVIGRTRQKASPAEAALTTIRLQKLFAIDEGVAARHAVVESASLEMAL